MNRLPIILYILLFSVHVGCNSSVPTTALEKTQKQAEGATMTAKPSSQIDKDELLKNLQGTWVHEQDNSAVIEIKGLQWTDIYQGQPITDAEKYDINIEDKLPQYADTSVEASFLLLTQSTDTIYFELLNLSESTLSLMHFPTGRIHVYKKNK